MHTGQNIDTARPRSVSSVLWPKYVVIQKHVRTESTRNRKQKQLKLINLPVRVLVLSWLAQVSITSLSLAHDDMVTLEGIESLTGLRALATLDISGCKVNKKRKK